MDEAITKNQAADDDDELLSGVSDEAIAAVQVGVDGVDERWLESIMVMTHPILEGEGKSNKVFHMILRFDMGY